MSTIADLIVLEEGVPPVDLILLPGVAFDTNSNRVSDESMLVYSSTLLQYVLTHLARPG